MNIQTDQDFQFALDLRRIIELGGSPSDLQYLFPDYFGYDESNGKAKAARIHKNLMPKRVRVRHGRIVSMPTLLKTRAKLAVVSDFMKLCIPFIKESKPKDNLLYVFLNAYETWLDAFEEVTTAPSLNFQQAHAVFKFTVGNISSSEPLQMKHCNKCNSYYPLLTMTETGKTCRCPYCR